VTETFPAKVTLSCAGTLARQYPAGASADVIALPDLDALMDHAEIFAVLKTPPVAPATIGRLP
jgi:hypothetical protein